MKPIDHKKLKSFKDIEIAKGKVRYEMLVSENQLYETMMGIERIFTLTSFFSRFSSGFSNAQNAYSRITGIFGKLFHRKSKETDPHNPNLDDIG